MRDRMKYACAIAALASLAMSAPAFSQANPNPNSAPNPYRLDDGWAKRPLGRGHGSTIGLNVDRDGKSMWIFDRCGGGSCEDGESQEEGLTSQFSVGVFSSWFTTT